MWRKVVDKTSDKIVCQAPDFLPKSYTRYSKKIVGNLPVSILGDFSDSLELAHRCAYCEFESHLGRLLRKESRSLTLPKPVWDGLFDQ